MKYAPPPPKGPPPRPAYVGPGPEDPWHVLAFVVGVAAAAVLFVVACVSTPAGERLSPVGEQAALAAARIGCAEEAAIPVVGQILVLACPAEVAGVQAGLDQLTAQPAPDAGAPALLTASAPLFRRSSTGLVHVGWVPAGTPAPAAQRLARACLGPSLPASVLPGKDGGR